MIAPVTPKVCVQSENTNQETRELLETIMTERFRRWLLKFALKWTYHDWEAAQDLVQETYLAILRSNTYDPTRSKPATFAFSRMKWQLIKRRWAMQSRQPMHALKHDPTSRPLTLSPETREVVEQVQAVIEQLPMRERDVITQRMHGASLQSIANQSGVTRERIRQIEAKGMSRLVDQPLPV